MSQKKKPPFNWNAAVRGGIRRAFARSPKVREKLEQSRRQVPRYKKDGTRAKKDFVHRQCEVCLEWVSSSKIDVDHINPVIGSEGFVDWNTFVERVDCPIENLQRICDPCHDKKTARERFERMFKEELSNLDSMIPSAIDKDFLKKFNAKRLAKYPYPQDFKDRIVALRRRLGMKV